VVGAISPKAVKASSIALSDKSSGKCRGRRALTHWVPSPLARAVVPQGDTEPSVPSLWLTGSSAKGGSHAVGHSVESASVSAGVGRRRRDPRRHSHGRGARTRHTLPEFLPTQVQIQTEALGLSAAEVEQFITVPLEDEFNGVPYVQNLRSKSVPGLSAITMDFPAGDRPVCGPAARDRAHRARARRSSTFGTPPIMLEPSPPSNA